jgi:membrane-anchored glycerophosphoryl diester phosphodiesterase (GDPDase)
MMSAFDFAGGAVLLGVVGMIAATIYFFYLQMRWIFAAAVLVLEERKVIDSMKRSFQVSKGSFWRIVGYYLLTNIILSLAVGMVSGVIEVIATAALGLDTLLVTWYGLIVYALIQTLTMTVTVGALSAVVTLLYVDIRMRREGLDIELIAAAQKQ